MSKLSVNAMFLDEPLGFYALAALAPYVDKILLTDTGSKPEVLESYRLAAEHFGNIELTEISLEEGGHDWAIIPGKDIQVHQNYSTLGPKLSKIRQSQHEKCESEYVWLLDGDEVYPDSLVQAIINLSFDNTVYSVHIPFLDFNTVTNLRQAHAMGRLFRRENARLVGNFPSDMFYGYNERGESVGLLLPGHPNDRRLAPNWGHVFHYETMLKPNRKPYVSVGPYEVSLPEVFNRYREGKFAKCYDLIKGYGF